LPTELIEINDMGMANLSSTNVGIDNKCIIQLEFHVNKVYWFELLIHILPRPDHMKAFWQCLKLC